MHEARGSRRQQPCRSPNFTELRDRKNRALHLIGMQGRTLRALMRSNGLTELRHIELERQLALLFDRHHELRLRLTAGADAPDPIVEGRVGRFVTRLKFEDEAPSPRPCATGRKERELSA